jgi:predicted acylesterase/phospholipase RssA
VREGIGVALSGGGHRASLFGLGVLLFLADSGRNHDVRSIASVSGGSLTNGFVAQTVNFRSIQADQFEQALKPFAHQLAQSGTLMNAPLTPKYRNLLLVTLALAAGPAWFLPVPKWMRFLITLGLVVVWTLGMSPLFGTLLGKAYGVLLGTTFYAAAVPLWLVPVAPFLRFVFVLVAMGLWVSLVLGLRGRVCAHAFRTTLFSPGGAVSLLSQIEGDLDHVICATELQSAEQVYFSRSFIYGYRFGKGDPTDLPLHVAVQASSCLPGAFPPKWLSTNGHAFSYSSGECPKGSDRLESVPDHLVLTDGGVYDNMADQWAQGYRERTTCWPALEQDHYEPEELIVVNASGGLGMRPMRRAWIPAFGELAALWKDKDVLYDQTTALRRQGLVGRFDRAELQGEGMKGALVHIPQSPYEVPDAFIGRGDWPGRQQRAGQALVTLGDTRESWEEVARQDAAVGTVLCRLGSEVATRLVRHGYVLAMVNLHVILGYPLLPIPPVQRFKDLVS